MSNPKAWGTYSGACKSCGFEMNRKKTCANCGAMYRKDGTYFDKNKQGEEENATKSHKKSHNSDEKENAQKATKATSESHKSHSEKATKSHESKGGFWSKFLNYEIC